MRKVYRSAESCQLDILPTVGSVSDAVASTYCRCRLSHPRAPLRALFLLLLWSFPSCSRQDMKAASSTVTAAVATLARRVRIDSVVYVLCFFADLAFVCECVRVLMWLLVVSLLPSVLALTPCCLPGRALLSVHHLSVFPGVGREAGVTANVQVRQSGHALPVANCPRSCRRCGCWSPVLPCLLRACTYVKASSIGLSGAWSHGYSNTRWVVCTGQSTAPFAARQ